MSRNPHDGTTRFPARRVGERGISRPDRSPHRWWAPVLAIAALLSLPGPEAAAQSACKPVLTVKDVGYSKIFNLRRHWTAAVQVDASRCATASGLFAISFVRQSETAPDLQFAEPFFWRAEETRIRVEFGADEAVDRYWISDVAACPCRGS